MSEPSTTNSELLKENAELKQRIQELEKSADQDEIGIFVRDIANSINNLLMGIRGIAAVSLLDFEPSHPHYENLKQIEAQVQSGVALTNQLLEFAIDHRLDVSSRGEKGVLAASDKEKTDSGAGIIAMGTETILLVDDERNIREVGQKMLESMGYNVYVAANGQEALAVYSDKKDEIALVILDIIMPVMSGGETYDRLKEINPNVNVLLSSGDSICGMVQEILDRGCQGFIQKPFSFSQFSCKIREMLDGMQNA
ncbi:MAG: response regulator [Smithellaceae bacterium]